MSDLPPFPEPKPSPAASDKPRILIAEDHPTNVILLDSFLEGQCGQLLHAANGQEAVDVARRDAPHLILMDINMPVMDGLEATRLLKADPATAAIPIIALTALAMPEDRRKCLDAGVDAYLPKPINLTELGQTLSRFLGHTIG